MLTDIKCTNRNGESIKFDSRFLRLVNGLDLSGTTASVNASDSNVDGSIYQSTRLNNASFEMQFKIMRYDFTSIMMDDYRATMYRVFNPKMNPIRIDFKNSFGREFYINAELVSTPVMQPDKGSNTASWQNGLLQFIATDPFIYAAYDSVSEVATWIPNFEFELEIPLDEDGVEFGYREQTLFKNVVNEGSDDVGILIQFRATGRVTNPTLVNINTGKLIRINTVMQPDDIIEISTKRREKYVKRIRDNVDTDFFSNLDYVNSTFLQLVPGDNLFRYDVAEGPEHDDQLNNLEVRISYRPQYVGV